MTARPTRFDAPDAGPGVGWTYDFDEHGHGRLLSGDGPIDLMHGRRFIWIYLMLANARSRDWIGSNSAICSRGSRAPALPGGPSPSRMA